MKFNELAKKARVDDFDFRSSVFFVGEAHLEFFKKTTIKREWKCRRRHLRIHSFSYVKNISAVK